MEKNYGFYSSTAESRGILVNIYKTSEGKEVEVTHVVPDKDGSNIHFKDKEFLGEVWSFVRNGKNIEILRREYDTMDKIMKIQLGLDKSLKELLNPEYS